MNDVMKKIVFTVVIFVLAFGFFHYCGTINAYEQQIVEYKQEIAQKNDEISSLKQKLRDLEEDGKVDSIGENSMAEWVVEDAGTTEFNGTYYEIGTVNNKPYYSLDGLTGEDTIATLWWVEGEIGGYTYRWVLSYGDRGPLAYSGTQYEELPANPWEIADEASEPPPTVSGGSSYITPPWQTGPFYTYSYLAVKYTPDSDEKYSTIRSKVKTAEGAEPSYSFGAQCAVYRVSDETVVETTEGKVISEEVERWYYFEFDNEISLTNGTEYYLVIQLWEAATGQDPLYRIEAVSGTGYQLISQDYTYGGGGYWPDPVLAPDKFTTTEDEYSIELTTTKDIEYNAEAYLSGIEEKSYSADINVGVHDVEYNADTYLIGTEEKSYNADINIGVNDIEYNSDTAIQWLVEKRYLSDIYLMETKEKSYSADVDLQKEQNIEYNADVNINNYKDINYNADINIGVYDIFYNADIDLQEQKDINYYHADIDLQGQDNVDYNTNILLQTQNDDIDYNADVLLQTQNDVNYNADINKYYKPIYFSNVRLLKNAYNNLSAKIKVGHNQKYFVMKESQESHSSLLSWGVVTVNKESDYSTFNNINVDYTNNLLSTIYVNNPSPSGGVVIG